MRSSWKSAVALAAFAAAPQLLGTVQGGRSDSTGFLSYPTAAGSSSWVGRCGAVTSAVNRQGVVPTGGRSVNVVMMAENETASSERRPRRQKKESGGPAAHFAQLKIAAKNRAEAKRNKEKRKSERDTYLEEMRKAFKLLQIKEREEEGSVWVTRPKRERQMSLTELKVGQSFEATVITVKEFGCYVDFGATRDGFVRLRDFSNTDFVLDARSFVKPGDTVTFHVRYVSPSEKIVTGAFFAGEVEAEEDLEARTPLSEVREDDELWGEVTKVSNYGAFLDVGVEVPGFLHVIYYPNKPLGALTQDVFEPGMRLRVWAMEVDTEKRRLKLTAERPRTLPRVDYAWYLNEGTEIDAAEPRNGFTYAEGLGLQRKPRAQKPKGDEQE